MHAECGLATIAIVGESMKHAAGIAGKLSAALGRSVVSVIACARGIGNQHLFVVKAEFLHQEPQRASRLFLPLNTGAQPFHLRRGTVGQTHRTNRQYEELKERNRLKTQCGGHRKFKKRHLQLRRTRSGEFS